MALVAEIALDAAPLVMIERDTFIVMIGHIAAAEQSRLVERQKAFRRRRHRHSVKRVEVNDTSGVGPGLMDGAMDREAGRVRPIRTFVQHSRSEEHTSELQSLMRISYAVFCL